MIPSILPTAIVAISAFDSGGQLPHSLNLDFNQKFDCGTVSVYYVGRLLGYDVNLQQLSQSLPTPPPEGLSFADLISGAKSVGFDLKARQLQLDQIPSAPAIFLIERNGKGHFIVTRPVGHTGKLVQLIDDKCIPQVLDISKLSSLPGWTGKALVPDAGIWLTAACYMLTLLALAYAIMRGVCRNFFKTFRTGRSTY